MRGSMNDHSSSSCTNWTITVRYETKKLKVIVGKKKSLYTLPQRFRSTRLALVRPATESTEPQTDCRGEGGQLALLIPRNHPVLQKTGYVLHLYSGGILSDYGLDDRG
jgi:hypothetical protein